jgi:hypothetical protein
MKMPMILNQQVVIARTDYLGLAPPDESAHPIDIAKS